MSMLNRLSTIGGVDALPTTLGPPIKPQVAACPPVPPKEVSPGVFRSADGKLFTNLPKPPAPQLAPTSIAKLGRLTDGDYVIDLKTRKTPFTAPDGLDQFLVDSEPLQEESRVEPPPMVAVCGSVIPVERLDFFTPSPGCMFVREGAAYRCVTEVHLSAALGTVWKPSDIASGHVALQDPDNTKFVLTSEGYKVVRKGDKPAPAQAFSSRRQRMAIPGVAYPIEAVQDGYIALPVGMKWDYDECPATGIVRAIPT